jgi:hypothetical protein
VKSIKVKFVLTAVLVLGLAASLSAQKKSDAETRSIDGLVTTRAGNPVEKAVVYLKNLKTLQVRTYIADQGGSFQFQGLSLTNDYELRAEHEGATSPTRTVSSFDTRKQLNVTLKLNKD